jgi:DNA-binding NarL/FixJ family response regulator
MSPTNIDLSNSRIHIIGSLTLQNEFLSYVISKEIGAKCSIYDRELKSFSFEQEQNKDIDSNKDNELILIDTENQSFEEILKNTITNGSITHSLIALFNLTENTGVEKKALVRNIRGFFYKDDHFEVFLKGIRAIFQGEIWVSRATLIKCVFESFDEKKIAIEEKTALTSREIEILTLVSMGSTNDEIADKMCISTNTVKTHLYNIFKKIKVENRLQAALWTASNI